MNDAVDSMRLTTLCTNEEAMGLEEMDRKDIVIKRSMMLAASFLDNKKCQKK
jgi:hypothetical protein